MVNSHSQNPDLGTAAGQFLSRLPAEEREVSQQEVYRFVRWYGWERSLAGLTPHEVAKYAEQLSASDTDYERKLELIRHFLTYAKKQGWSQSNLSTHLKTKKARTVQASSGKRRLPNTVALTQQGYAELEAELAELKNKREEIIEEIRRAAADKDFRENAPLAAAREQKGHIEGQIMELGETLKEATVISGKEKSTHKAGIGYSIVLSDLASSEELHYTLVHPREVDPSQGKISSVSPIGKALVGRSEGEIIEITVPAGKLRYRIKQINR